MNTPALCPVCLGTHAGPAKIASASGDFRVDCPVCGRYALPSELWEDELDPQTGAGHKLSEMCRARLAHRLVSTKKLNAADFTQLTSDFFRHFVEEGCPGPSPAEQATNIIRYVGDDVSSNGKRIEELPEGFYAIIGAPNPDLAAQLVRELWERGILRGIDASSADGIDLYDVTLTLSGWEKYEAEKRGEVTGNYGFIAMKFDDIELDPFVDEVVKPAVREEIGYRLVDMRDVTQAGIIDNIMRQQIRDAAFVLVDLTHDNSGAYWEAGYAEGLGKPVIYLCEKAKFDDAKTHFDTNHCTTVLWSSENVDQFRQELIATLRRSLNLFPDSQA